MTITEFAETRNQQPQTISKYINRHADKFKGHTKKIGKSVELDKEAVNMLGDAYPLPKPVTIVNGVPEEEHLKALADKDEQIRILQSKIISMQEQYSKLALESADLKAKALLLEDKEKRIEDLQSELQQKENRNLWQRIWNK